VKPEPLYVGWQGRRIRVRHDDPRLGPYSPGASRLRSAVELASDIRGLRGVLLTTMGDRYDVEVTDDATVIALRRRHRP
jgi:hypothetical protein